MGEIYEIKKLICQLEGIIKDTTKSSLEQTAGFLLEARVSHSFEWHEVSTTTR